MVFILLVLLRTRNFSAPYYFVLLHTISYYFARARARTRLSRAAFVNNFPSTCRLRKGSETRRGSAHSLRLWQSGALALTADNGDRSIPCNCAALARQCMCVRQSAHTHVGKCCVDVARPCLPPVPEASGTSRALLQSALVIRK